MPKKSKGGKGHRKGKAGANDKSEIDLLFKEDGQAYAQVLKMMGDGRTELHCEDTIKRTGHIRGVMKKKVWICAGDFVLVGLRDYQESKCDIIHKYSHEEAQKLKAYGELNDTFKFGDGDAEDDKIVMTSLPGDSIEESSSSEEDRREHFKTHAPWGIDKNEAIPVEK
jgi:translation initiation factor 1A